MCVVSTGRMQTPDSHEKRPGARGAGHIGYLSVLSLLSPVVVGLGPVPAMTRCRMGIPHGNPASTSGTRRGLEAPKYAGVLEQSTTLLRRKLFIDRYGLAGRLPGQAKKRRPLGGRSVGCQPVEPVSSCVCGESQDFQMHRQADLDEPESPLFLLVRLMQPIAHERPWDDGSCPLLEDLASPAVTRQLPVLASPLTRF